MCCINASLSYIRKLPVIQNHLAKTIIDDHKQKVRLKPLCDQLQFLKVEQIFKFGEAKFMGKLQSSKIRQNFFVSF